MSELSVKDIRALAEARFWRRYTWQLAVSGKVAIILSIVVIAVVGRFSDDGDVKTYELEDGTEVIVESRTLIIGGETVALDYEKAGDGYLLGVLPLIIWIVFLCLLAWKQARFRDKFIQKWVDAKEIPDDLSS